MRSFFCIAIVVNWDLTDSFRCLMQNDECKMQNHCVAFGDYLKSFSQKIPQFCILNSAFCISHIGAVNCNLNGTTEK